MELTVNQFSKGLQLDTHPMVLGNDSLSDALNATFVTMNGNEIVLQNDMGNRRVDNAFLPPGYLPVGMKEYGGIIYVAAYNPITNKSQIGSFPSPEKKISDVDDESLGGEFDFDIFLNEQKGNISLDNYLGGIKVLNTDSFMIPLTGDTSLRAGDKFAVWANSTLANQGGLAELSNYITNYKNVRDNKAISPKNRKYTLLLGILNSQNEFVDITKTLCRWEKDSYGKWNPKKYDYSYSDVYKFNDEYFIPDGFTNINFSETIKDSKLIKERLQMAANTYAYKLIGPLYLKANLNHIYNFNYTIYGTYDDGLASLLIEGYLTYNCQDGVRNIINNSNENYLTFEEGIPTFRGFDLLLNGNGSEGISTPYPSSYNPNANLYTVKIVKEYSEIQANPETKDDGTLKFGLTSTTYNYIIGVLADKDINDIYLRGLSVKGQIDLALLGSGKVFFTGWRFYNNPGVKTTLYYSINSYPKKNEEYKNLIIKFTDVSNSSNIFTIVRDRLDNGAIELDWNEYGIVERTLYRVEVTYDIFNKDTSWTSTETIIETDIEGNNIERWFLSTPLFNDFYLADAGVPDYCDFNKADLSEEKFLRAKDDFEALMIVNIKGDGNLIPKFKENVTYEGGLTKKDDKNISYICNHNIEVNILNESKINILERLNYPKGIEINSSNENALKISSIKDLKIGDIEIKETDNINDKFKEAIKNTTDGKTYYKKGNPNNGVESVFNSTELLTRQLTINQNLVTGNICYRDVYKAYSEYLCDTFVDAFDDFFNVLDYFIPINLYFGIIIDWDALIGSRDEHYLSVGRNDNDKIEISGDSSSLTSISTENGKLITVNHEDHNGERTYYLSDKANNGSEKRGGFFNVFNSILEDNKNKNLIFSYIFLKGSYENSFKKINDGSNSEPGYSMSLKTRVWWKGTDDKWAMFLDFLDIGRSIKDFIKDSIKGNYIYCVYNECGHGNLNIYVAPEYDSNGYFIYTKPYENIEYILGINYELTDNNENILQINVPKIGNLEFKKGNFTNSSMDTISIKLNSNSQFHNNILSHEQTSSISNIYLPEGIQLTNIKKTDILIKDSEGNIMKVDTPKFRVEYENRKNKGERNILLYICNNDITLKTSSDKPIKGGDLEYIFLRNVTEDVDSRSALVYDQVCLVDKEGEDIVSLAGGDRVHSDSIISTGQR